METGDIRQYRTNISYKEILMVILYEWSFHHMFHMESPLILNPLQLRGLSEKFVDTLSTTKHDQWLVVSCI